MYTLAAHKNCLSDELIKSNVFIHAFNRLRITPRLCMSNPGETISREFKPKETLQQRY